ncbi:Bifunctional dehydrogenase and ferrochelatase [Pichia californica]|uniref:precorrin-2 dehydrogenase n=1 Tax=Pichia californica TaxID=460514 RepID=A0A9P6WML9_9ASCO|nr:Bifunctional dehydrogenase and ferrochelatase [[Candida] californica]
MSESEIVPPPPNGSLMLAWQVKTGDVALSRIDHLLQANAKITVVAGNDIHPTIKIYYEMGLLQDLIQRKFKLSDLKMYEPKDIRKKIFEIDDNEFEDNDDNDEIEYLTTDEIKIIEIFEDCKFKMVLTCINDYQLSLRIWQECKKLGIDVNLADKPSNCDFYFGSVYRNGPLQIMISTNGNSPRLCNRIKNKILIPNFEKFNFQIAINNLSYLRNQLRTLIHPGEDPKIIKERMEWNKKITDFYSIQDWCNLNHDSVDKILKLYPDFPTVDTLVE